MTAAKTVHIWLAMDPETRRVSASEREYGDGDFPPGLRGAKWPVRELDVPAQTFTKIKRASFDGEAQDRLHRDWWDAARGPKDPVWPLLPGDQR